MTPDELHGMLLMAAVEGCCANDKWHGRLCTFHSGYDDGLEAGIEAYAKLLEASDPPPAPLVADPKLMTHIISAGTVVPPSYPDQIDGSDG